MEIKVIITFLQALVVPITNSVPKALISRPLESFPRLREKQPQSSIERRHGNGNRFNLSRFNCGRHRKPLKTVISAKNRYGNGTCFNLSRFNCRRRGWKSFFGVFFRHTCTLAPLHNPYYLMKCLILCNIDFIFLNQKIYL